MKRILAILLAGILTVSVASCGNTGNVGAGTPDANMIVADIGAEPAEVNSMKCSDAVGEDVLQLCMSGLVRLDEDDVPQLDLAESYEVSQDGKTYTFKLRQDAKWTNGEPVTANDYLFAWRTVLDPNTGSQYAFMIYSYIENGLEVYEGTKSPEELGVKAIDDYTLEVKFTNPVPYALHLLSFYTYYPVNEKAYNEIGADNYAKDADKIVTNGAYKMESWVHDDSVTYVKNPDYHRADDIKIEKVKYVMLKDENARLNAWKANEVDIVNVSGTQKDALEKEGIEVKSFNNNGSWYLQFNTQSTGLNNAKIRKAIAMAIDTQSLCDNVLKNGSVPATGLTPGGINGINGEKFVDSLGKLISYNADEAKKLLEEGLAELGMTADQINLKLVTDDTTNATRIAQFYQEQLKSTLGINITIAQMPFKSRIEAMNTGDFDIVAAGWSPDYNDPMTYLDMFTSTNANNYGKYSNPEYDKLITTAMNELDVAKRQELLIQAEKLLIDDAAIAPMFFSSVLYVQSSKVSNYSGTGFQEFDFTDGAEIVSVEK